LIWVATSFIKVSPLALKWSGNETPKLFRT
jgi:hypothetical protein